MEDVKVQHRLVSLDKEEREEGQKEDSDDGDGDGETRATAPTSTPDKKKKKEAEQEEEEVREDEEEEDGGVPSVDGAAEHGETGSEDDRSSTSGQNGPEEVNNKRLHHQDSVSDESAVVQEQTNAVCTAEVCGTVCSKSFLISINLTFVVLGWLLIGCGVWLHIFPESFFYSPLFIDNPTGPIVVLDRLSVALIVVGVILFVVGFLGGCGTCTESVCFLGFFSTLVILSIGTQVIVVILAASFKYQIQSNLERSFYYQVRYEYNNTAQYTNDTMSHIYRLTIAWDRLQSKLGCCGSRGPQDYPYSSWSNHSTVDLFVPSSCCVTSGVAAADTLRSTDNYLCQFEAMKFNIDGEDQDDDDDDDDDDNDDDSDEPVVNIYTKGCSVALSEWAVTYLPVITVVVLLDALQVINLFYACCLIKDIRQKLSEYSWCEEDEEAS